MLFYKNPRQNTAVKAINSPFLFIIIIIIIIIIITITIIIIYLVPKNSNETSVSTNKDGMRGFSKLGPRTYSVPGQESIVLLV